MKVAIYFSGHLRTYDQTWNNWKQYVIDPLNADVFIATWPNLGRWVSKGVPFKPDFNDIGTVQMDSLIDTDKVIQLMNPKKFTLLDNSSFENETSHLLRRICEWRDSLSQQEYWGYMPRSHVSQYYSWKKVDELRIQYEKETSTTYDLIIRARTDMLIEDYINPLYFQIPALITQIRNDIDDPLWINDIMFVGGTEIIHNLCQLYDSYETLFETLKKENTPEWFFSSHKLIPYYLMSTGSPWLEVPFPFKRYNHSLLR